MEHTLPGSGLYLPCGLAKGAGSQPTVTRHHGLAPASPSVRMALGQLFSLISGERSRTGENKDSKTDHYLSFFGINTLIFHGWKTGRGYHREKDIKDHGDLSCHLPPVLSSWAATDSTSAGCLHPFAQVLGKFSTRLLRRQVCFYVTGTLELTS